MSQIKTLSLVSDPENYEATNGSSLQGYIRIRYTDLVKAFGEPGIGDEYKVQAEWRLVFTDCETDDDIVATIYDWKQGDSYCGEGQGRAVQDITLWNVGGFNSDAVYAVSEWLNMHDIPHNFDSLAA